MRKNKFSLLFLLFLTFSNINLFGKEHIILRSKPHGMFSMFHFVLFFLQEYEKDKIEGLQVDFAKTGLYYDEKIGPNWWEYYFEPINLGNPSSDQITVIEEDTPIDPNTIEFANSLETNHDLVIKYIKPKQHIVDIVDQFQNLNFNGKFVIGIHYRGTDKTHYEAPRVSYIDVIKAVRKILKTKPKYVDYNIFIATDELPFLEFMQSQFQDKISYCPIKRSTNGHPLHIDKDRNPYQTGEDALVDALLLSSVDFLIRTSSNLSLCSRYFNPKLPALELSQRTQETIPCLEFYR